MRRFYLGVRTKFLIAQACALGWAAFSVYLALPWMMRLSETFGWPLTIFAVGGVAIIPGYASAFMMFSVLLDWRPKAREPESYPPITVLVAAYNEEDNIKATIDSIFAQHYPGDLQVIVIDDGSRDATPDILRGIQHPQLTPIIMPRNGGKAEALNEGLRQARHKIVLTVDADTYLYRDALKLIVARYLADPPNTVAVAGAIAVRNSRSNWITKLQEWDYFHGISVVKRIQSLYQGTLVAQGAFSLYDRDVVREVGGWPSCVGEDIVLTWSMLKLGYRVGYAENAVVFTNAPETYKQLYRQRQRWARGMFEAMRAHPDIFRTPRLSLAFIIMNTFFPWVDLAYLFCFVPGLIAAAFGYYEFVGLMTLFLLPLMLVNHLISFAVQTRTFGERGLRVRRNYLGFVLYALACQFILCPASLAGYLSEVFRMRKIWGTK
jgi:biofilm PGA synthesis N-glycosyltransferase PgaC